MLSLIKYGWLTLVLLLLLLASTPGLAQRRKAPQPRAKAGSAGRNKDFFRVKSPTIRYVRPDTTVLIETEDLPDDASDAAKSIFFNPAKKLSIVSEDTATLDEGEPQIVEMSEEVLIDSSWVKVAGYYAIWDTHNINPYRVDGRRLRDTLNVALIEPQKQRFAKMPLKTTPLTSDFGFRGYRWHYGVDLDLNTGDTVRAAFDGVVRIAKYDGSGYGYYLLVRHYNGLETLYGHLSRQLVAPGTFVKAGQVIGLGGSTGRSTGSHLHYEVRYEGNPIDPERVYDFPDYKLRQDNFQITSALFAYYSKALAAKARAKRSGSGPSAARRVVTHRIRNGDTLSEIADKYGVSQAQLRRLNGNSRVLRPGRTLRIK
ncbi:peptidoglycan DD-metalloendopeptidase family protein [Hymenobacter sp. BT175]|uniref:peptidoglycan DD-metalloendopeptidase family protein n=1 Tax=Hymenobacter translucens TaxID=2886507 RepID=UPI001D0DD905|nr:peptidoglycan DD-metalloendopeptidase family protein [Hymenobacter translucens]MCC2544897.1 peptidoglycan DD-metalloendopeptidase family protein [Hymenobacter translucens]